MTARISVLLPYRNASGTLAGAIASVLDDLRADDEVVAIDDGSSDGSTGIVDAIAARDRRVTRVATEGTAERGAGIARALARGVEIARADAPYLGRMDADDLSLPGRFEAQRALLEQHPDVAAVGTQVELFGEHEGMARYIAWQNALVTPEDHAREIFVEAPLCHPSVLLRRDALAKVGGFRDTPWPEDYDLWLRLDAAGFDLAKVPRVLFRWQMSRGSVTKTDPRAAEARLVEARATYLAPWLRERAASFAIWGAGQTGRRLARALEAYGITPAFFADIDPKKVGGVARGRPIVEAEHAMTRCAAQAIFLVVAVGTPGARAIVRGRLVAKGFVEGSSFVCGA